MPKQQTDNRPRKQAKQARSKRTIHAILKAAAHILKHDGLLKFTTNRVAARANVSVGSIYQYFPNKQSILLKLMEAQLENAQAERPAELDSKLDLKSHIEIAVQWHLRIRRKDPLLFQRLFEIQRDLLSHSERASFERSHEAAVYVALERYSKEIRVKDLHTASLVVSQFLLAATQSATALRPELANDSSYESEITDALMAYLSG